MATMDWGIQSLKDFVGILADFFTVVERLSLLMLCAAAYLYKKVLSPVRNTGPKKILNFIFVNPKRALSALFDFDPLVAAVTNRRLLKKI